MRIEKNNIKIRLMSCVIDVVLGKRNVLNSQFSTGQSRVRKYNFICDLFTHIRGFHHGVN